MKKYLVAALVACLGILSVNAQVDKTIEVSQCEANNKLTVEGQTLISTNSVLLKMKKPVKLQLIQVLLPKFPLGWEKTKK